MKRFKNALFLATVASGAILSSGAQAQITSINDGERQLHGTGATSIQTVLTQELNCVGGLATNPAGTSGGQWLGLIGSTTVAGTTSYVAEPTNLTTPGGGISCLSQELNPGFLAHYVGSGSGTGRDAWANAGSVASRPAFAHSGGQANPNPFGDWSTVQYAFADNVPSLAEIATFTGGPSLTAPSAAAGGAPVVFPKFVLPVAIAYAPVYGHKFASGQATDFTFNINSGFAASTTQIRSTPVGGMRLSRTTLCGIFSGAITNYNDSNFTTDNGGVSLRDPDDSSTRWTNDGVPVRLVGRLDRSGTTDIFTRGLAAQCSGAYVQNAETLPYVKNATTSPDFSAIRADTGLRTGGTDGNASNNTALLVSNQYYNRSTGTYGQVGNSATGAIVGTAAFPATATASPGRANGTGVYLVADGSGGVAAAINKAPDWRSASYFGNTTNTDYQVDLNGKIGYIGADYLAGSPTGAGLHAAALRNNNVSSGTDDELWVLPSAAKATIAFGTIAPPAASGDPRVVNIPGYLNGGVDTTGPAARNNPRAWYDVIYVNTGLADPAAGYPITGTTQFLGYTCYKGAINPNSGSNLATILNFLGWNANKTLDSTNTDRTGIFTDDTNGLLALSNIGALPANWRTAVNDTFLSNTSTLNLNMERAGATGKCSGRTGI